MGTKLLFGVPSVSTGPAAQGSLSNTLYSQGLLSSEPRDEKPFSCWVPSRHLPQEMFEGRALLGPLDHNAGVLGNAFC